jgi:hypothetical protein
MDSTDQSPALPGFLQRRRWLIYLLPLVVYMAVNSLEPTPPPIDPNGVFTEDDYASAAWIDLGIRYRHYPLIYTGKLIVTLAAMAVVWPGYRRHRFKLSPWAVPVGMVGAVVWVGLWKLDFESMLGLRAYTDMLGRRSGFNPLAEIDNRAWAWGFLAIRFFGLVVVVAIIEEFFLRGFVMRFPMSADWWNVPIGRANATAVFAATLVPVLMHPAEPVVAVVWFTGMTGLVLATRNIWDCVLAHGVTNLLMGAYVVLSGDPEAWQLM